MASLRTDTGFFKETILIPSRPTMTSFFYLFLLQFTRLLIPTEHRASIWVREWATTQNQLFRPRKLRRGTSSVLLSGVWCHCFYEALTSWPCYAWLRIRQGREDLAWIGRETRAGFKGWHPKDKLKWTGNRRCPPRGGSAFAEESRRQERNKFTHTSLTLKQARVQKYTGSTHSNSYTLPGRPARRKTSKEEIKHNILVRTLIFTLWSTKMLTAIRCLWES